ncbi:MAG: hypothetical protein HBSAPP01_17020 [Candidatus Brocadia sapporoensis]|nr:MAG: hypothetical protein HBSAPP01_17020 [Candidatus Brocadia sapporoensis]
MQTIVNAKIVIIASEVIQTLEIASGCRAFNDTCMYTYLLRYNNINEKFTAIEYKSFRRALKDYSKIYNKDVDQSRVWTYWQFVICRRSSGYTFL